MASVARGPTSVSGSIGSPVVSASIRPMNRVSNSSAISSLTMKRLAAMQDWPLLMMRACTAVSHRRLDVGVRKDDERIASAELEHGLLQVLARGSGHGPTGRLAPGQRDGRDPGVGHQGLGAGRRDEQRLKRARRETGFGESPTRWRASTRARWTRASAGPHCPRSGRARRTGIPATGGNSMA